MRERADEGRGGNDSEDLDVDSRRMRFIMFIPIGWLVVGVILPNFVLGSLNWQVRWLESALDAIGIILFGGCAAFLLLQIRKERWLIHILAAGMTLSLLSVAFRIERTNGFFINRASPVANNLLRQIEIAFNGLGLGTILFAFFYAVIDLLAVRRRLVAQQTRLSNEIARRKRIEEEYQTILHTAMDGFWIVDSQGRILDVNDTYCRVLGYSREALLKMSVQDVEAAEAPAEVLSHLESIRGKGGERFETRHRKKDGAVISVEISTNSLPGMGDRLYVFLRDITELKRAEALLVEQRMKMIESARLSSLGTMAGGVAHEINNPLAVIAGCAEQLEGLGADADPAITKRLSDMVRRNAARIQGIVQGLRNLSRNGSSDPFVRTSVADITTNVLDLCRERFQVSGVEIRSIGPAPSLTIECRPSQVSQVILNLLNNSFHAVEHLSEKWIRLDATDLGENVEIAVVDSGTGISENIAGRLFTPFFTTKFEQRGLGLGLSISHAIAEAHDGELRFDSSCANTRFVLRLPKHQTLHSGPQEEAAGE